MSLFSDPSPEREPSRPGGSLPRATVKVKDLNPICVQIPLEHTDRLLDVSYLAGITPNEEALQYIWRTLRQHQLIDIDAFHDHLGALGFSLELKVSAKHEIEWRENRYTEQTSVALSTKHREGSELGALRNENAEHPGQEGLILEIVAGDDRLSPLVANITWDEETLHVVPAGIRWDFLRTFHSSIKLSEELPEELPIVPGHHTRFHFLHLEMGSAVVRAERITDPKSTTASSKQSKEESTAKRHSGRHQRHVEITLTNAPAEILAAVLEKTGTLQLQNSWTTPQTRLDIINHMLDLLERPKKLNVDTLMMCESAHPCLVFAFEETSDGEAYPARRSTQVSMMDYTCSNADFRLDLTTSKGNTMVDCRWTETNSRFNDLPWNEIFALTKPYMRK